MYLFVFFHIGEFDNVLETFDFFIGMSGRESGVFRKYEDRLIKACAEASSCKCISINNLVEIIIAGEKLKLDKLLSYAITLASTCSSRSLRNQKRYKEISNDTQSKINEKRVTFVEDNGDKNMEIYECTKATSLGVKIIIQSNRMAFIRLMSFKQKNTKYDRNII